MLPKPCFFSRPQPCLALGRVGKVENSFFQVFGGLAKPSLFCRPEPFFALGRLGRVPTHVCEKCCFLQIVFCLWRECWFCDSLGNWRSPNLWGGTQPLCSFSCSGHHFGKVFPCRGQKKRDATKMKEIEVFCIFLKNRALAVAGSPVLHNAYFLSLLRSLRFNGRVYRKSASRHHFKLGFVVRT